MSNPKTNFNYQPSADYAADRSQEARAVVGLGGDAQVSDFTGSEALATQAELDAHGADTRSAHVVAGLANFAAATKVFASGDVNKAHGNAVTVTGIAVGDQLIAIVKDAAGSDLATVDTADATIGAGTLTFTATDFGATDGIFVVYLDLT